MADKWIEWNGVGAAYDGAEEVLMRDLATAVREGRATRRELMFTHRLKAAFPGARLRVAYDGRRSTGRTKRAYTTQQGERE